MTPFFILYIYYILIKEEKRLKTLVIAGFSKFFPKYIWAKADFICLSERNYRPSNPLKILSFLLMEYRD